VGYGILSILIVVIIPPQKRLNYKINIINYYDS